MGRSRKSVKPRSAGSWIRRFLMFNLVGALLPLAISWFVRVLAAVPAPVGTYASEFLFFAVMISATAVGDLSDEIDTIKDVVVLQYIRDLLSIGALAVAALFGVYQYAQITGPSDAPFLMNITSVAGVIAIGMFIPSLIVEIWIARIKGGTP